MSISSPLLNKIFHLSLSTHSARFLFLCVPCPLPVSSFQPFFYVLGAGVITRRYFIQGKSFPPSLSFPALARSALHHQPGPADPARRISKASQPVYARECLVSAVDRCPIFWRLREQFLRKMFKEHEISLVKG